MAATDVKVIFHRRHKTFTLICLVGILCVAAIIGVSERDPNGGVLVGVIGAAILLGMAAFATRWAGQKQLSWIAESGQDLLVRRVHFLDRGELLRIPKAEISDWHVDQKHYKGESYSNISFRYGGRDFEFYLSADAHPDMEAIDALLPDAGFLHAGRT